MSKKIITAIWLGLFLTVNLFAQDISVAPEPEPDLKICQNCDTIILEENKPQIIFYDICPTWDYTYNQPIKNYKHPIFTGSLMEREWNELKLNFPDIPMRFINRQCLIEVPNLHLENVNLLSGLSFYSGFLYWSGKYEEPCIKSDILSGLTELVAKSRNEQKTSSYIQAYPADTLELASMQNSYSPSKAVRKNPRHIPFSGSDLLEYFPYPFMKLGNVKKIFIGDESFTQIRIEINFNKDQTINKVELFEKNILKPEETLSFSYQEGLLKTISDARTTEHFFYKGDTVLQVKKFGNGTSVSKYILKENTFLPNMHYFMTKESTKTKDPDKKTSTITSLNGITCVRFPNNTTCYSNLKQTLPLKQTDTKSSRGQYNSAIEIEFTETIEEIDGNLRITNTRHYEEEGLNVPDLLSTTTYIRSGNEIKSVNIDKGRRKNTVYFKYEYFQHK